MRAVEAKAGGGRLPLSRLAIWLLPFLAVVVFLLWQSRGQTLYADEWFFLVHAAGFEPGNLLAPDQGNLVFGATLVYKLTLSVFGADSHLPLRLVWICLDLLCSAFLFLLLRKRIGDFAAYVSALVLAVFGSAWEMFSGSLGINVLTSVAAGLAALLMLERDSRRGDVLGCLLLTFSVIAHSTGLSILAGVIVAVLIREDRLRRLWVVAIPVVLYAAWWLWARKFGQSSITLETVSSTPAALVSLFAAAISSMTGAFRYPGPPEPGVPDLVIIVNEDPGLVLGALLLGAVGWRLSRLRFESRFVPPLVTLVVYWATLALVSPARVPGTGRYQYASAIFILLVLAELWRGWRPARGGMIAIAALGVVSIVPNAINLHYATAFVRGVSEQDTAKLAVADALRSRIPPDQDLEPPPYNIGADVVIPASQYFKASDEFGSPASSLAGLNSSGAAPRLAADRELVYLLNVKPVPTGKPGTRQPCERVAPGTIGGGDELEVAPGGFSFRGVKGGEVTLGLRRFGYDFYRFEPSSGDSLYRVRIPVDSIHQPWYADFEASEPILVCALT
jgi:hypothetical protein